MNKSLHIIWKEDEYHFDNLFLNQPRSLKVTKGKYVPKLVKEYDCEELFQSPLFDQPSKLLNPNGRW